MVTVSIGGVDFTVDQWFKSDWPFIHAPKERENCRERERTEESVRKLRGFEVFGVALTAMGHGSWQLRMNCLTARLWAGRGLLGTAGGSYTKVMG